MKLELLDNGCLKILLSDEELAAIGLDFSCADDTPPHTRAAIRKLVRMAGQELEFPTQGNITVEAIPLDSGCLLLLSPTQPHGNRPLGKSGQPHIYRTANFDAIVSLAEALPQELYTSLYVYNGQFYLCHYPFGHADGIDATIREFMTPVQSGYGSEAVLGEHGTCLATGDALTRVRLTVPGYRTPKPPDPPH